MFQRNYDTQVATEEYRPLLRVLASTSPVCSFIHPNPESTSLFGKIASGLEVKKKPADLRTLSRQCPVLFNLLSQLENTPAEIATLVRGLLDVTQAPFNVDDKVCESSIVDSNGQQGGYFPNLSILRNRHRYKQDKVKEGSECKTTSRGHHSLLPGVFCLFCEHGMSLIHVFSCYVGRRGC